MKNFLLLTFLLMFGLGTTNAQTNILDFETPATTTDFEFFGSSVTPGLMDISIANPAPAGINTSATVAEFTKPPGSEVWAGAYGDPATTIDFTTDNAICLKVWVDEPTNLLLKLEGGANGAPNWELQKPIDDVQTWVEVCYSVTGQVAEGQAYSRLVLFFDYGTVLAAEKTYYFDDVVTKTTAAELYDVTFSVDMNGYTGAFDSLFVSGTFNGFADNSNPLSDMDGDGIWTHTIEDIGPGNYEYLFQLDKFGVVEDFTDKYYDCTQTTFGANGEIFVNRTLNISADEVLPTVCFNSCYACGGAVTLSFFLGEGNVAPSADGFYIAGGGNFDVPGTFALTDEGNGIHTARFEKVLGFASFYAYANGACLDFSCKENLAGQDCADPNNFDDRFLGPIDVDTNIRDCYETCNEVLQNGNYCLAALPIELQAFTGRNINGINELTWKTATEENSDFFEIQKSTDGMNFVRIGAVAAAGTSFETLSYSFVDATPTLGNNYYRLRMVDTDGAFDYSNVIQITRRVDDGIGVYPSPANAEMYLVYDAENTGTIQIQVINTIGQTLLTQTQDVSQGANTYPLDVSAFAVGTYLIQVTNNNGQTKVKRFVKN